MAAHGVKRIAPDRHVGGIGNVGENANVVRYIVEDLHAVDAAIVDGEGIDIAERAVQDLDIGRNLRVLGAHVVIPHAGMDMIKRAVFNRNILGGRIVIGRTAKRLAFLTAIVQMDCLAPVIGFLVRLFRVEEGDPGNRGRVRTTQVDHMPGSVFAGQILYGDILAVPEGKHVCRHDAFACRAFPCSALNRHVLGLGVPKAVILAIIAAQHDALAPFSRRLIQMSAVHDGAVLLFRNDRGISIRPDIRIRVDEQTVRDQILASRDDDGNLSVRLQGHGQRGVDCRPVVLAVIRNSPEITDVVGQI